MNPGQELEEYIQRTYRFLLNMKDEGVTVERNIYLAGKSTARHQIDVFYQFKNAGVIHRVAIECKDHSRPIDKGRVQEFANKIQDIGGISGIMISQSGFQSGAELIANHFDIILKTTKDLPTIPHLMGTRIATVALPEEDYKGEPFWVIMEHRNGKVTGSYFCTERDGHKFIPLFFSKYHAQLNFDDNILEKDRWCVRGLPRYAFRAFLLIMELCEKQNIKPMILFRPPGDLSEVGYAGFITNRDLLVKEYYGEALPRILE
ncbi:restriction endonuclease [Acinetobacter soli]|uniref:restriction endonuclease n=1 Tax=Acinetobacter soli TaxID=487316 RepID=UPI00125DCF44|nr:restriction endonuclease [Acinetobacter soli]